MRCDAIIRERVVSRFEGAGKQRGRCIEREFVQEKTSDCWSLKAKPQVKSVATGE